LLGLLRVLSLAFGSFLSNVCMNWRGFFDKLPKISLYLPSLRCSPYKPNLLGLLTFMYFFLFCSTEDWTQGLACSSQVLPHLSCTHNPVSDFSVQQHCMPMLQFGNFLQTIIWDKTRVHLLLPYTSGHR
jgi:hypothetical protein